ncbi:hypothetical protein [Actinoplanes sp. NPDC051851]
MVTEVQFSELYFCDIFGRAREWDGLVTFATMTSAATEGARWAW